MKRYLSLDLLRGLSVFGMVFSAIIPFGGLLPRWMYHIQNPPPTHELDMSVSGISWVDLVFPIFIFCMGVAIPLAGRRHLTKGTSRYVKDIFERFLMLWAFSYLYVFLNFDFAHKWIADFATLLGFLSMFFIYMVIGGNGPEWASLLVSRKKTVRIAGITLAAALILYGHFSLGMNLSVQRRGIIIFLLAFLYLFGSMIWLATRDNHKLRLTAFLSVLLFCAATMPFGIQGKLYAIKSVRWFFNMEYIYFLLILIPATYIGDLLYKKLSSDKGYHPFEQIKNGVPVIILMLGLTCWQMVALYNEWHIANIAISALITPVIWLLTVRNAPVYKKEVLVAIIILLSGLISVFIEGGIKKVPCTVSYCFVTTAISIFLLIFMDFVSTRTGSLTVYFTRIFSGAGSNPLISYIAFGNLLMPLFKVTGLIFIYQAAYPQGYPWVGALRAFIVVLLTMSVVALMSEKKIYWRA